MKGTGVKSQRLKPQAGNRGEERQRAEEESSGDHDPEATAGGGGIVHL